MEGDVLLELAVDNQREVFDARVLSGPDELRKAALQAVLQWHYSPAALRSASTQVTLGFHVPPPDAEVERKIGIAVTRGEGWEAEGQERGALSPGQRAERRIAEIGRALGDPAVSDTEKEELKAKYAEAKEQLERWRLEVRDGRNIESAGPPKVERKRRADGLLRPPSTVRLCRPAAA